MKKQPQRKPLPHRNITNWPVHIVYRLAGSIPKAKLLELKNEITSLTGVGASTTTLSVEELMASTGSNLAPLDDRAEKLLQLEAKLEELLDQIENGPMHLLNPVLANVVLDSWHWLSNDRGLYVYCVCVMGNHVHALVSSKDDSILDIGTIVKNHKSYTATICNKHIQNTGNPFWEPGYFDRDLREGQFSTLIWYILNNPVKVGLVNRWSDWKGTYLNPDWRALFEVD